MDMDTGRRFTYQNIGGYESAIRMKDNIGVTSWPVLRVGLMAYCNFLNQTPDEIIADRNETFQAKELPVRRKHEDLYIKFIAHLGTKKNKGKPLAPKTVNNMLIGVKSFYTRNFVGLVEPKVLEGVHPIKVTHIPTQEELGLILDKIADPVCKAAALAEAQGGTSIGDLLTLTWDKQSDTFGTIRKQVDEGILLDGVRYTLVHFHSVRQKTNVAFDSFWGAKTVEALRVKGYPKSERVFPTTDQAIDDAISDAAQAVGIAGDVTSHMLRKFFSTQLKLANVNNDLVEYWQGHALQGSRGAYFIPPPERQAKIYLAYEWNITPISKGAPIVTQQPTAEAQLAQGPVVIHELPAQPAVPAPPPTPVVPAPSVMPVVAAPPPQPVVAQPPATQPIISPLQQVDMTPVVHPQPNSAPVAPAPVVMTPPPKTVLKVADLLKRLEKKQQ